MNQEKIDKIIEMYPVKKVLELSSKARQSIAFLNQFKDALGTYPDYLNNSGEELNEKNPEEVVKAINEFIDQKPLQHFFSMEVAKRGGGLIVFPFGNSGPTNYIESMIWAAIFEDYSKHLEMSFDVFRFLQLKIVEQGNTIQGCMVVGYHINPATMNKA